MTLWEFREWVEARVPLWLVAVYFAAILAAAAVAFWWRSRRR